jgi:prepilin-type N-terminal cleavage/methylation domain-containing protein
MLMRGRGENGFTLIEVLVTMAIALVVFGATLAAFTAFQREDVNDHKRNETQDAARTAIDRLARQLRNVVAPSTTYAGALETAEEYSIEFETVNTSNLPFTSENPRHAMRVRYCLDGSEPDNEILREYTQEWTGSAPERPSATACNGNLAGGWTGTRKLVEHVTNRIHEEHSRPLFAYSASEVPQIVTVTTDLYLNVNPGHIRPGETRLESAVGLRNANRKPVAKFTVASEAGYYKYRLNASESYDPGGLALTYKWWRNGSEICTSQICQTELAPEQSYTFVLEVTNPGGLSESAKQELTTPGTKS